MGAYSGVGIVYCVLVHEHRFHGYGSRSRPLCVSTHSGAGIVCSGIGVLAGYLYGRHWITSVQALVQVWKS